MPKTRVDEHLSPDLRLDQCQGTPHDRLLIQIDRRLASIEKLLRMALQVKDE